jgi:hypothetical protein
MKALDRTRPVLPLRAGVPARQCHDYIRHGTTSWFAALDIATGKVIGSLHHRQRHPEFLHFSGTHRRGCTGATGPSGDGQPCRTQNAQGPALVRTSAALSPALYSDRAGWLNQVERFVGLLTDRRIRRGTFGSAREQPTSHALCLDG